MSKKLNKKDIAKILNNLLHSGLYQQFGSDVVCIGYIISTEEIKKIAEYIGVETPNL